VAGALRYAHGMGCQHSSGCTQVTDCACAACPGTVHLGPGSDTRRPKAEWWSFQFRAKGPAGCGLCCRDERSGDTDTDGLKAAGEVPPAPSTPADRLALWCSRLPAPAPEMLRTLAAQGERYMDADELAAILGKKPSGGYWNSGIAVLRNNGLIEIDGRRYRAAGLFRE